MFNEQNFEILKAVNARFEKRTFCQTLKKLPTIHEIKKETVTDGEWNRGVEIEKSILTLSIRERYIKNSFVILSHEFLTAVKSMVFDLGLTKIVDLCCGVGWFSHWLRIYGIPVIDSVDDKSRRFYTSGYLDFVKKCDAVKYIRENRHIEMFILSWPEYTSPIATKIWEAMRPNQYLFYIGEGEGGCTADDGFFRITDNCEVTDRWGLKENFISFSHIHDKPILFKHKAGRTYQERRRVSSPRPKGRGFRSLKSHE